MRTFFTREPWRPMMGTTWDPMDPTGETSDITPKPYDWSWLTPVFGGIKDVYTGYQTQQTAQEIKDAQEAKLAAERARLEAERLRIQQQQQGAAPTPMVLGIPRDYLVVGGVGLAVIATVVALSR